MQLCKAKSVFDFVERPIQSKVGFLTLWRDHCRFFGNFNSNKEIFHMLDFIHTCSYAKQSRYLTLWRDQYKAKLVFEFVAWSLQIFCNLDNE